VPVAGAYQDEEAELFEWDKKQHVLNEFKKVDIPVYVPSFVASASPKIYRNLGRLYVSNLEVSKDYYLFQISRQRVRDEKARMLALDIMTTSAGTLPRYRKQAFSTYEMFEISEGTILLISKRSFGKILAGSTWFGRKIQIPL
jgi:hypothetical protein